MKQTDEKSWKNYVDAIVKQKQEEYYKFYSGVEGWYGDNYYKMINGHMTAVESSNGDNSSHYTD